MTHLLSLHYTILTIFAWVDTFMMEHFVESAMGLRVSLRTLTTVPLQVLFETPENHRRRVYYPTLFLFSVSFLRSVRLLCPLSYINEISEPCPS